MRFQEQAHIIDADVPFLIRQRPAPQRVRHHQLAVFLGVDVQHPHRIVVHTAEQGVQSRKFGKLQLGHMLQQTQADIPLPQFLSHILYIGRKTDHVSAAGNIGGHLHAGLIDPGKEAVHPFLCIGQIVLRTYRNIKAFFLHFPQLFHRQAQGRLHHWRLGPVIRFQQQPGVALHLQNLRSLAEGFYPFCTITQEQVFFHFVPGFFVLPPGHIYCVRIQRRRSKDRVKIAPVHTGSRLLQHIPRHGGDSLFPVQPFQRGVVDDQRGHAGVFKLLQQFFAAVAFPLGHHQDSLIIQGLFHRIIAFFNADADLHQIQRRTECNGNAQDQYGVVTFFPIRYAHSFSLHDGKRRISHGIRRCR